MDPLSTTCESTYEHHVMSCDDGGEGEAQYSTADAGQPTENLIVTPHRRLNFDAAGSGQPAEILILTPQTPGNGGVCPAIRTRTRATWTCDRHGLPAKI